MRIAIGPWNMMQRCLDALVGEDATALTPTSREGT
jgi:hypothetical protein